MSSLWNAENDEGKSRLSTFKRYTTWMCSRTPAIPNSVVSEATYHFETAEFFDLQALLEGKNLAHPLKLSPHLDEIEGSASTYFGRRGALFLMTFLPS